MVKRRLSLVPAGALRRIVDMAVDRALERGAEGRLADLLAQEMVRAIRREARSVQGMSRGDVLEELKRRDVLPRRVIAETHDALIRVIGEGAASREERAVLQMGEEFARAEREGLTLDALRVRMESLVRATARHEHRELLEGLGVERDRQVDLLERRIAKLNRTLEISETALRELAARKSLDEGLASFYRTVQGLSDDAPGAERKKVLLEELFLANVELRMRRGGRADVERVALGVAD